MQFRRITRLTFCGGPIRSHYELRQNLASLGCDFWVLTTGARGLDAPSMSRRTGNLFLRKTSESAVAIDIYAILRPQSCASTWSIHSRRGHCAPHRILQLPHVPDAIPLPLAQETFRLVAPRWIAVLGRLNPLHPNSNLGFPLVYHKVEMMGE